MGAAVGGLAQIASNALAVTFPAWLWRRTQSESHAPSKQTEQISPEKKEELSRGRLFSHDSRTVRRTKSAGQNQFESVCVCKIRDARIFMLVSHETFWRPEKLKLQSRVR